MASGDLIETRAERNRRLGAIIKPLRTAAYEVDFPWAHMDSLFAGWARDYGGIEFDPDFQRGHVWTPSQQCHFIENILRGVVSSSGFLMQFNCANWDTIGVQRDSDLPDGFQCIDGLQRITAVREFLAGRVRPFGLSVDDLDCSSFSPKSNAFRFRVAVHDFQFRADLLQHYIDLNSGGTPHSNEEIARVRRLLESAQEPAIVEVPAP